MRHLTRVECLVALTVAPAIMLVMFTPSINDDLNAILHQRTSFHGLALSFAAAVDLGSMVPASLQLPTVTPSKESPRARDVACTFRC